MGFGVEQRCRHSQGCEPGGSACRREIIFTAIRFCRQQDIRLLYLPSPLLCFTLNNFTTVISLCSSSSLPHSAGSHRLGTATVSGKRQYQRCAGGLSDTTRRRFNLDKETSSYSSIENVRGKSRQLLLKYVAESTHA
jgi:hypothetical protein